MLHCKNGIGLVMSGAWFPPNITPGIHAKEFNLCLIRPDHFVYPGLRVLQVHFGKLQPLRSGFRLATLPYRPDLWIAAEMVVLLEGSPLSTEEHWSSDRVTIGFLVTSLTKALLPRSLSLDGRPALGRVLVVPNFFHLRMMEATVLIGQQNFFFTLTQICSSRQSCIGGLQTISLTSCLVCALTCTVNCGTLYRQVCAFPNHVQSTEFTTGGLQLSCRNISRMISGNRMHLSSILSFMAKAVNNYVQLRLK